ncbi:MAG TPA: triple tyrosine motif-containing protein, partial [Nitrospirota bacterium]
SLTSVVYAITDSAVEPATLGSIDALPVSPVDTGTPVTITLTASSGSGTYEYRYWVYNGTWTMLTGFVNGNTYVWTPTVPGNYEILGQIRNKGSLAAVEDSKPLWKFMVQ